jgi:hypothetical protein
LAKILATVPPKTLALGGAGGFVTLVALAGLWVGGCGGCGSRPDVNQAGPSRPVGKKVAAKLSVKGANPAAFQPATDAVPPPPPPPTAGISFRAPAPTVVGRQGPETQNPAKGKKSGRPNDVADWKREDYEAAARENDPQLLAAVGYLGAHFAGKETAAEFLLKLLQPSSADPFAENAARTTATTNAKLSEAVVAALAANGTPRARQILESLVNGTPKTTDPSAAAVAALKTLAARPGPDSDDLLVRVMTAPSRDEPDDLTADGAARLRSAAMALVRSAGSESLRVRLAGSMVARETSPALYDRLWSLLKEPRSENLAAQLILYQSDRTGQATRGWLEPRAVAYSSSTLGWLMGRPSPGQPKGVLANNVPAANPYRLAERLWSLDFAATIQRRLEEVEALDKASTLMALAGTLPQAAVRAALLRTLERHWDEGPAGLKMLRGDEDLTVDPGFVVVVKRLRRDEPARPLAGKNASEHNGSHHGPPRLGTKKAAEIQTAKQHEEEVGQQWMEFSRDVVQALCRQLYAADSAQRSVAGGADRTADDADLPLELFSGSRVVAAHRLDWPEDLGGRIAAGPRLRVRYVRIQQRAVPLKMLGFYRRQLPGGDDRPLSGGGRWLDNVVVDKQHASMRSVDVLLTKASKSAVGLPNQELELNVDILTVECEAVAKQDSALADR